jgi:creatinine amidohydrolase
VREIDLDRRGVSVIFHTPSGFMVEQGEFADLHAGASETALILHLRPDLVHMERAKPDFAPSQGREFFDYTGIGGVSPTGLWGAPSEATAEQGEESLQQAVDQTVSYIEQTFADIDRIESRRGVGRDS